MAEQADLDLKRERDDLVARPREDALVRVPFDTAPRGKRTEIRLPDGYMRFEVNRFNVDVSPWGLIMVRQADWLSKFAFAIQGDTRVAGLFARVKGDEILPIPDENHIETGEVLLYLPTYRAALTARDGLELVINGKTIRKGRPKSREDLLRDQELRRLSAEGDLADTSLGKLTEESPVKAVAFTAIKAALDTWLESERDLELLTEEQKEQAFVDDQKKTVKIILYEFFSGSAPSIRNFHENHAITQAIRDGPIGQAIGVDLETRFGTARGKRLGPGIYERAKEIGRFTGNYAFSPDDTSKKAAAETGETIERGEVSAKGAAKSLGVHVDAALRFYEGRPVEFFIGGCSYVVETKLEKQRQAANGRFEVPVTVIDEKSLKSLFGHSAGIANLDRPSALEEAAEEGAEALPYSTTTQRYHFFLPRPF